MNQEHAPTQTQNKPVPDVFSAMFKAAETKLLQNYAQTNQQMLLHMVDINFVCKFLNDLYSRNQYTQRLMLMSVEHMSPYLKNHYTVFNKKQTLQAQANLEKLKASGQFPKFKLDKAENKTDMCAIFGDNQATYPGIVEVSKGEVVLNCGAGIGLSSAWFYMQGAQDVYSFEVDPLLCDFIRQNLALIGKAQDELHVIAAAVNNEQGQVWFTHKKGISQDKPKTDESFAKKLTMVQREPILIPRQFPCLRLDDWCTEHNVKPTFIRLDIHGSEPSALQGAADTIKAYRPKLVIRLDGKIQNMWEIPLYLNGLVPEYKFYARPTDATKDLFLYAIA